VTDILAAARTLARTDSLGAGCSPQTINAGECDVSVLARNQPDELELQPVGGSVMLEGNVEVRFPLMFESIRGAAFLDIGQVWRAADEMRLGALAWSPGLGVRYYSPIGPVRVDIGYNPASAEQLAVLSTEVCQGSADPCGPIAPAGPYNDLVNGTSLRAQPSVLWDPYDSFTDRLQIHFSIGQAF